MYINFQNKVMISWYCFLESERHDGGSRIV
jgi:hypothetical protein